MKKILIIFSLILIFLAIKILNSGIRLSDTTIYYNLAYQISHGKILYKDIFFLNFPFFSYIFSIYYFLSRANLNLFFFTASLEVSVITFIIYFITYKKTKDYIVSAVSSGLYAFSFMVLSTSDHQTGVFAASLFSVLGYLFLENRKILLTGIFIALAVFTKAYFVPIFISFLFYIALKEKFIATLKFIIAFTATGIIISLPFLIIAPKEFFYDIFGFSLSRPAGLSKTNIMWFFISKDFLYFVILIFNILNARKNLLFAFISIFSIILFFGYQDIYYLYLNFLAPFACLSFYEFYSFINSRFNIQKMVVPTIISIFILINITTYLIGYRNLAKLNNFDKIIETITLEKPEFLYGVNDITPAIIAITKIPALNNIHDAHEYYFMRGIYDKKILTKRAVNEKTIIITHGAYYPNYNIKQGVLDDIFVKETIYNNCQNILSVPVQSEGDTNRINLFKCY